ncbi:LAME_0F12662g1_1 [Lachancea meyersii CBS 8951]|uniref:LAME_0F12662g1_1 n=1 Tax=Lachancea meyersii CBS 8951 TaxID=1266667 RepID=A0A1G4JX00_9SACH|nr:LAME_0F12662g1_1 [Lachancea meyersii CBS 8951]
MSLRRLVSFKCPGSTTANVLGIGTDIVYLPRFAKLVSDDASARKARTNNRILGKFMHATELSKLQCMRQNNRPDTALVQYVAGVWATKEAVYKCFASSSNTSIIELPPAKTIYTRFCYKTNDSKGIPKLVFDQELAGVYPEFVKAYIDNTKFLLSISHDADYLVSYVCHVRH